MAARPLLGARASAWILAAFFGAAWAQDPPTLPEVRVEAEATPGAPEVGEAAPSAETPAELPPAPSPASLFDNESPPSLVEQLLANSPFDYDGSPFNLFDAASQSLTGAPISVFDSPRAISILDQTRIQQRGFTTAPELLQNIPGVLIQRTNGGGGSLIIRGRNGNQNLIMVDGVPINDSGWRFNNIQYLNTIDPGVIERIEVIRGPASVLYGSGAVGGVLNILTKRRQDYSTGLGLNGDIYSTYASASNAYYGRLEFQGNVRNLGFLAGTSYLNSNDLYTGQGITFTDTGYNQIASDLRLDYLMDNGWTATAVYQFLNQPFVPRTDIFPVREGFFEPQRRNFAYVRLSKLDETDDYIQGLQLTFNVAQRLEGFREFRPANNRLLLDLEEIWFGGVDLRAFSNLPMDNTLTYGATYYHDTVDAARRDSTNGGATFQRVAPALPNDGEYGQFGVFLMDRWSALSWLDFNAGVRYSHVRARGTAPSGYFIETFDDWSNEFGAVVKLTDQLHLNAIVSKGFRAPNFDDLASSDRSSALGPDFGTVGLASDRVWNYETGFKYLSPNVAMNFDFFYSDLASAIVRTPRPGGGNIRFNSEGMIRGIELDSSFMLTSQWSLYTLGSYIWGMDTVLDSPIRVPPGFLSLGSRYTIPRYNLFFELWAEMMGLQNRLNVADFTDPRIPSTGTPAWQTINSRAGVDLGNYGRLIVGLYNMADQNYRIHGSGLDAPGIEFRASYDLHY